MAKTANIIKEATNLQSLLLKPPSNKSLHRSRKQLLSCQRRPLNLCLRGRRLRLGELRRSIASLIYACGSLGKAQ
jgi:hypothetical protein